MREKKKKKIITDKKGWEISANIVMSILSFMAVVPFFLLIISSFTSEDSAIRNGYSFVPEEWSIAAYQYLLGSSSSIIRSYGITIVVVVLGTVIGVCITSAFAYVLSKQDLPGRNLLMFIITFTMLFNGGAAATYIIYSKLFNINNTIWALIIPGLLMNAYQVIMFRTYFQNSTSQSLLEASRIDGASELKIFIKIVVPLSLPMYATIGISQALMYWNDWTNGRYYISKSRTDLQSIMVLLNNVNENVKFLASNSMSLGNVDTSSLPTVTIRMAIGVIGVLPILILYPFFQKWFIRGIMAGAVKE